MEGTGDQELVQFSCFRSVTETEMSLMSGLKELEVMIPDSPASPSPTPDLDQDEPLFHRPSTPFPSPSPPPQPELLTQEERQKIIQKIAVPAMDFLLRIEKFRHYVAFNSSKLLAERPDSPSPEPTAANGPEPDSVSRSMPKDMNFGDLFHSTAWKFQRVMLGDEIGSISSGSVDVEGLSDATTGTDSSEIDVVGLDESPTVASGDQAGNLFHNTPWKLQKIMLRDEIGGIYGGNGLSDVTTGNDTSEIDVVGLDESSGDQPGLYIP